VEVIAVITHREGEGTAITHRASILMTRGDDATTLLTQQRIMIIVGGEQRTVRTRIMMIVGDVALTMTIEDVALTMTIEDVALTMTIGDEVIITGDALKKTQKSL